MCNTKFHIPSEGLDGLRCHFVVQQLMDAHEASGKETQETPCEVCVQESGECADSIPAAAIYCVDCDQKLCDRCSRPHRRMRSGAHQLRPLEADSEEELIQLQRSYCEKHKDKQVELYCYECNENICVLCFAVNHSQHKSAEIPEAAKAFTEQINSDAQQVWLMIRDVREKTPQNDKIRNVFLRQADKVKSEIKAVADQINEIVANQVAVQLDKVDTITSEDSKTAYYMLEERYQTALAAMQCFHTYAYELLDKGRPSDITRAASQLHKRVTELLDSDVTSVQYCPPHVTFTPADVTQVKHLNLIGEVNIQDETQPGTGYIT